MLLKADASQLEWRVKVYLSQDPVGMQEINEGYPIHDDNQKVFGLPTRTIAKIFLYRIIFADSFGEQGFKGPAFAYANDSDFRGTSTSAKFWESVIAKFFDKYKSVYNHSVGLIREAIETGRIVSPSGRIYLYHPILKWNGDADWPRSQILNHIVQGLSADFIMIARRLLWKRLHQPPFLEDFGKKILLINTVHDDIELDVDNIPELVYNNCLLLRSCFQDIPKYFEKNFGHKVNVPMDAEAKFGFSLFEPEMVKFNKETFKEDYQRLCNSILQ